MCEPVALSLQRLKVLVDFGNVGVTFGNQACALISAGGDLGFGLADLFFQAFDGHGLCMAIRSAGIPSLRAKAREGNRDKGCCHAWPAPNVPI